MATEQSTEEAGEVDINDLFDSIVLSETNISDKAFKEGFLKGSKEGKIEGFHLGFHRGAEFGLEIGFYSHMIEELKKDKVKVSEKAKIALEKLEEILVKFPKKNDPNIDIIALRSEARSQYKKVGSLFKIDSTIPFPDQYSF